MASISTETGLSDVLTEWEMQQEEDQTPQSNGAFFAPSLTSCQPHGTEDPK